MPQTSSDRIFPDIQLIADGYPANPPVIQGGLKGETLSTISRIYSFSLTLRDGRGGVINAGSNCSSTTFGIHEIYTEPGTGPFKVNFPNGGENWSAGSQQAILWDVAGTTGAAINTQYVNISLSTDGGLTYPYLLATWVANDGFEIVTMPYLTTAMARIKVEALQNYFFDISNANFSIAPAPVGFEFTNPEQITVACPASASVVYSLGTISNGGYVTPINLTSTGVPAGVTIAFSANPVIPGNPVTVTLSNTNTLTPGKYHITITGTSASIIRNRILVLDVQTGAAPLITVQPVSYTDCWGGTATFTVTAPSAISYQWQISTDNGYTFSNITTGGSQASFTTNNYSNWDQTRYRCIVTGQCNSTISNVVQFIVLIPASIYTQPQSVATCEGRNVVFQLEAANNNRFQWQVNKIDGVGFVNISNETNKTLNIAAVTTTMSSYQYRCLVYGTNCITPVFSNQVVLTVNPLPSVSLSVSPYTKLLPGMETTLTASANVSPGSLPVSYMWRYQVSDILGNVTGNTHKVGINRLGLYSVEVRDAKGCIASSATILISDSVSGKLYIYPNPTSGVFTLVYHNAGGGLTERKLLIYNAAGQKIVDKTTMDYGYYPLSYQNLSSANGGMYYIELRDKFGLLLAKEKLLLLH